MFCLFYKPIKYNRAHFVQQGDPGAEQKFGRGEVEIITTAHGGVRGTLASVALMKLRDYV